MTEISTPLTALANGGDAAVIRDLAHSEAARTLVDIDGRRVAFVLEPGQHVEEFDREDFAATPYRRTGSVQLVDADSFVVYVKRYLDHHSTTLWSAVDAGTVTAVLDDHDEYVGDLESAPGWGQHRAYLTLKATPDWKHWAAQDGKLMAQTAFAEHIEEGASAIIRPAAADMLELVQTFIAKKGVDFKQSTRLASGETQFQYEETIAAKAGVKGRLEIPNEIILKLQPFEGSPFFEVTAKFRYRINDGQLTLAYKLIRPDDAKRAAFAELTAVISDGTGLPIMAGSPRSS